MHRPLLSPPLVPRLSRRKYTQTVSLRVFIIFFRARARSFLTYGYAGVGRFLDKSGRFSVDSFDPRSGESPNLTQIREIAARRGYLFAHCRLSLSLSLFAIPAPSPSTQHRETARNSVDVELVRHRTKSFISDYTCGYLSRQSDRVFSLSLSLSQVVSARASRVGEKRLDRMESNGTTIVIKAS